MGGRPLRRTVSDRSLGVATGLMADRLLGEPPARFHPVAGFGSLLAELETHSYADARVAGVVHCAAGAGLAAAAGVVAHRVARTLGSLPLDVTAAVAVACAGRMLRHSARTVEGHLQAGDLPAARRSLRALVGRDPSSLDEQGVAAAVVESLAENTVDAVVAPVLWGLVAGTPGVLVHRAVNTLDAMVGHRSARYARFGWASARSDDAMAWVPARIMAVVVAGLSPTVPGPARPREVLRLVRRDAPAHPSPNAGVAETAVAAALGVQLGGTLRYGDRTEHRPLLGEGARPDARHIAVARQLVDRVELVLLTGALLLGWVARRRDRPA